ncbi:MAG: PKD domain-containing protein, partial [Thermoplasmata archaeon]|nr:PKD domain-containing protein [Thermoplasmata archaeon]
KNMLFTQDNGDVKINFKDTDGSSVFGSTIVYQDDLPIFIGNQNDGFLTFYEVNPADHDYRAEIVEYEEGSASGAVNAESLTIIDIFLTPENTLYVSDVQTDSSSYVAGSSLATVTAKVTNQIGEDVETGITVTASIEGTSISGPMSYSSSTGEYSTSLSISSLPIGSYTVKILAKGHGHSQATGLTSFSIVEEVNQPPVFAGLESAMDASTGGTIGLDWNAASDPEGNTPITYNIYQATTSGGQNFASPTHTTASTFYSVAGLDNGQEYYFVVRAEDSLGKEETNTIERSATPTSPTNQPPTANAGSDQTVNVGETVTFGGSGTDSDGTIVKYEWDFDGDGIYDWNSTTTGSTTHKYDVVGTYTAVFRVTDNEGLTDTDTLKTTVRSGEKEGFPWWILVVILVVIGIVLAIVVALRKKPKTPTS